MTENKIALTSRENGVLALIWQCFETEPKVSAHCHNICLVQR
jgi:hypothetical protein